MKKGIIKKIRKLVCTEKVNNKQANMILRNNRNKRKLLAIIMIIKQKSRGWKLIIWQKLILKG
jgi:hypothetical protein